METRLYRIGEFAKRAGVSVRTLRFYDHEGLLQPSEHSFSGHRLYSDEDLIILGRIQGLKQFGFTLAEIRAFLGAEPESLSAALARQRSMLEDRRSQMDRAIRIISDVETELRAGEWNWDSVARVVEVINMSEDKAWVRRHLTPAQLEAVQEISNRAYSTEAYNSLRDRTWTEDDQIKLTAEWNSVYAEAARLANTGVEPSGPDGLALGARYKVLIEAFTLNDPEVQEGLGKFFEEVKQLPPEKSPYSGQSRETMEFAQKAYEALLRT